MSVEATCGDDASWDDEQLPVITARQIERTRVALPRSRRRPGNVLKVLT